MKLGLAVMTLVIAVGLIRFAQAVPPGLTLEFEAPREGKVLFEGNVHSGTGMYCADCHMAIFDVSRAAQITRADHSREVYCFTCHNGEIAFAPRRNCSNCHAEDPDDF